MTDKTLPEKPLDEWDDAERIESVKLMFNTIVPKYDLMNRIMSGRLDIAWRRFAARRLTKDVGTILDVATGTGDLAIDFARRAGGARVCGIDFSRKMMELAVVKTARGGLSERIDYIEGDATAIPFGDDSFDAAGAAFGIRNVPDKIGMIGEMRRVVKPGGKVMILEMTFPKNLKLRAFFIWYFKNIIPRLGSLISGNGRAYKYLPESIRDFLHPDQLTKLFRDAGLVNIREFPLSGGLTYLHEGIVPQAF